MNPVVLVHMLLWRFPLVAVPDVPCLEETAFLLLNRQPTERFRLDHGWQNTLGAEGGGRRS